MRNLGEQFQPVDYDEHLPHPGDKRGRVTFGGKPIPATSFHKGDHSMTFTTPLENGAVARVSYFPRQKQTNVSMMHMHETPGGQIHGRLVGAVDEHGRDAHDVVAAVHAAHGERKPDMPRSPEEALDDLKYYGSLRLPHHVQEANRRVLPKLRKDWEWKP